ncbi:uncharacterized protein [Physcomitrium patens]|uniref:Epidermal patterning factor-like protein n=1 Tax=Physcomitrium patens TaxID=3218 RepID=A9TP99_PHYPA|nr:uncharacterized protein LOC112283560 isoform X2 [Physcomitrium patens]PNR53170.1 hypothetical protein PHYPA_009545 [Physcomitrium patens]|eukprot:XP_024378168.1 uncharacterized protein LOC112283560 isoform X2 [Physcomitrella patens]
MALLTWLLLLLLLLPLLFHVDTANATSRVILGTEAVLDSESRLPATDYTDIDQSLFISKSNSKIETEGISPVKAPKPSNEKRLLIGSSAPECGHTCGACSPCKIQIVSYECEEDFGSHAEACPLGYLCLCHGKSFPIP